MKYFKTLRTLNNMKEALFDSNIQQVMTFSLSFDQCHHNLK